MLILGVFGLSMIALYLASTLYHAATTPQHKRRLKYCDHAAIFLLIAGTYTPFCLIGRGREGFGLVVTVWIMAALGIIAKFFLVGRFRFISTLMYLLMGWVVVFHVDFLRTLPDEELNWLVSGGMSYSIGTIFYLWRSLPFSHAIWHLFVLGGSACHYLGVLLYLAA
jgi:hemolysin III